MSRPPLSVLVAYPYVKKDVVEALAAFEKNNPGNLRLLLDSGAFTAWKSGNPIKLDDYCRFLETLPFKPWRYITLDVVGNAEETARNYEIMLERGFNPVPVFTPSESLSAIDDLYKTSDYIAAGGLVGKYGHDAMRYLDSIMKTVNGRKIHLLGYTSMPLIKHFRPFSCDSSSWEAGARYGRAPLYLGHGNLSAVDRKGFIDKPDEKAA